MSKSPSTNVVLLVLGSQVLARFEPTTVEKDDGTTVTRQAMTQAKAVLNAAAEDSEHDLHEAVMSGNLEMANTKLSPIGFKAQPSLTIG